MSNKLEKIVKSKPVQFAKNLVVGTAYAILPTSLAYYSFYLLNNYGRLK